MIALAVGFVIAVTPTMFYGIWNGQSLLGLIIVLIAGWRLIVRETTHD